MRRPRLVLASRSERRQRLLQECHIGFEVVTSTVTERSGGGDLSARMVAMHNSRIKALDVARSCTDALVLGFDTVVSFRGKIFGKPKSRTHAWEMLTGMNGKMCFVFTGVTLADGRTGRTWTDCARTKVYMKRLSMRELQRLFPSLGPYDKAGGFTVEGRGALLLDRIEGCFYNVLGLPVSLVQDMFKKAGFVAEDFLRR